MTENRDDGAKDAAPPKNRTGKKQPGTGRDASDAVQQALDRASRQSIDTVAEAVESHQRLVEQAASGTLADAVRAASEQSKWITDSAFMQAAHKLSEQQSVFADSRLKDIIEQSNQSAKVFEQYASSLREPIAKLPVIGPSPEVEAAWTIQSQLPTLVEMTAESSRQIARMAAIAQESLAESKELRTTMADYATEAKRSGAWLTRLTWVIAILTLLLLLKELEFWPFLAP